MSFQMYVSTMILFGSEQLNSLSTQKMPGKKALIVISNGKSTKENGSLVRTTLVQNKNLTDEKALWL